MNAAGRAEQERIDPVAFGEWHYKSQSSGLCHEISCETTCPDIIAIAQRREGLLDEIGYSLWGKLVWDLNRPRACQGRGRVPGMPAESGRAGKPWRQYAYGEVVIVVFDR